MSKFYFLRKGDVIREYDEFKGYNPACTKLIWIKIIGREYRNIIGTKRGKNMVKIRRRK